MKTKLLSTIALLLLIAISGCHSNQNHSDYCTVKESSSPATKTDELDVMLDELLQK